MTEANRTEKERAEALERMVLDMLLCQHPDKGVCPICRRSGMRLLETATHPVVVKTLKRMEPVT